MLQTISQLTLCLMLVVTTAWCIAVYRKLTTMKSDGEPIKELVNALNQATKRADQTILGMRLVIKDADSRLAALADLGKLSTMSEVKHSPGRHPIGHQSEAVRDRHRMNDHRDMIDQEHRLDVLAAAARRARSAANADQSSPMGEVYMEPGDMRGSEKRPQIVDDHDRNGPYRGVAPRDAKQKRQRRYEDVLKVAGQRRNDNLTDPQILNDPTNEEDLERLARSIASLR